MQDAPRQWETLSVEEQTRLRVEHQRFLDTLPPPCSMETKVERFRAWLAERGIAWAPPSGRPSPN